MKKKTNKTSPSKKDFLVVGLGASAGGVKALQEFFATMPPNSGMAFVVILHLSPKHESNLAEILGARTEMPVVQVKETHKVEPNKVYVIPPNGQLEMVDGVVRCKESKTERGSRVAIDVFFRTLAEAYERNGVCVVLSGTGSDGTMGLKRVKEANGFAVVQDPHEAEYDDMPRSAIATGLVDWVLPIAQMPEKLINFRASSERLHLTDDDPQKIAEEINAEESLRDILAILRVRTGHDFSSYKTPTLVRRIARHLQIHELEDIPSYLNFLRQNPDEILSLQRNLLINVTNFFRDKTAFDRLETEVIPQLFADKTARDTVRVWCAGCASGEEAYSLAIILCEHTARLKEPPKIQIFATDVDDEAIAEAREGVYPNTIEADVTAERLKRFFVHEGNHYRVKKEIREKILFAPHNVLRDPPFSKLNLITCRNVLIYLNRETQDRVIQIFHFALATGGYLFLGSSESADNLPNLFAPVDKKHRVYSRRPAQLAPAPLLPLVGRWQSQLLEGKSKRRQKTDSFADTHYKLLEKFSPPSVLINRDLDVVHMSKTVGRFLRFAGGEPTRNLLKIVHPDLMPELRHALLACEREGKSSVLPNIRVGVGDEERIVNLFVRPADLQGEAQDLILVVFNEQGETIPAQVLSDRMSERTRGDDDQKEALIWQLEDDLTRAKSQLRSTIEEHEVTIEELKASNEELQAINEELRSAGEELETSKEELQSVNEELTTVNHELKEKIDEVSNANSDLQNLMASTEIATIFLDKNLHIKRYTPPAQRIFNITATDIGRPLGHFTNNLEYKDLSRDAAEVLRSLKPIEREISGKDKRCYLTHFVPYRTTDDRIVGAVLNFVDITERKRNEEALRESEARFRAIINQATANISEFDQAGDFTLVNQTLCNLLGYREAELLKMNVRDVTHPEDLPRCLELFEQATAKGAPSVDEKRLVRKDNTIVWINESISSIAGEDGRTPRVAAIAFDITERKRTEEHLRQSEERLNLAASVSGFGVHDYDAASNTLYWSPQLKAMHGLAANAPVTMEMLSDFVHPDDRERVERAIQGALDPNGTGEFEQEFRAVRRGADEILWLYNRSRTTFAGKGKNRRAVRNTGIVIDITERRRIEAAARETEEHLRIAVDAAEMGTWDWNIKRSEVFWNERHFTILGMKPRAEAIAPEAFFDRIHPEDREWVMKRLEKAVKTDTTFEAEFRILREDTNETRWMEGYGHLVEKSDRGEPVRMSGVMSDITDRRRAEQSLVASNERLQLLIESASDYAIFTTTLDNRIESWNAGAEKIFGWTEKEALGQLGEIIFTPEDRAKGAPEQEMKTALRDGRAPDERFHLKKDGTRFYVSGVMNLLRDAGGNAQGFVKIARDMSAHIEAEKAVRDREMLRRLIVAQEDERRRIARDIHDHFGQQLTTLRLKLDAVKKMCSDQKLCDEIEEAQKVTGRLDADVDFIAWELRPVALDDLGLRVTLNNFVREWSSHTGIEAEFHVSGVNKMRLSYEIETNLYRIAQEALNNIYKHAQATRVDVVFEKRYDDVVLIIEDDGVGFNADDKKISRKGIGLSGMRERAKIIGGELEIESGKNSGTTVYARVPIRYEEEK